MRFHIGFGGLLIVGSAWLVGCDRPREETAQKPQSQDGQEVRTVYESGQTALTVHYADEQTLEQVRQGLYWYNQVQGTEIEIEQEGFLRSVVPVLNRNSEGDPEPLYISRTEAERFYQRMFRRQAGKQEAALQEDGKVRFRIEGGEQD